MIMTYYSEDSSPETEYVFDFIFRTIGLKAKKFSNNNYTSVDIYYGNNPEKLNYKIRIPDINKSIDNLQKDDVIWQDLLVGGFNNYNSEVVPFDIINAIRYLLIDYANDNIISDDQHSRLMAVDSYQFQHDIFSIPIVNAYILFLSKLIEVRTGNIGIQMWPVGKKCAIALTHDVDVPDRRCFKNDLYVRHKTVTEHLKKKNYFKSIKTVLGYGKYLFKFPFLQQNYWNFEQIINLEKELGMKSTFFFASRNVSDSIAQYNTDVTYNIKKKKFNNVFEQIKKHGFEIGLHSSYNAYKSADHFLWEKEKLEHLSGVKIIGQRHHYWHLGDNIERTLEYHEKAGFKYDSSLAFMDMMGFRRNVAMPYYPWSRINQKLIKTIQVPAFIMDGNIFLNPVTTVDEGLDLIKREIEILKKYKGLGAINWHVRTSLPTSSEFKTYGEAYPELLKYLAEDTDIWITNMHDVVNFILKRWQTSAST